MAIRNFYLPKRMGKRRRAEEDRDISTTLVPLAADLPTWLLFFKYRPIQRRSARRLSSDAGRNQKQKGFSFSFLCEFFFVETVFLILVLITTLLSIRSVVIMSASSVRSRRQLQSILTHRWCRHRCPARNIRECIRTPLWPYSIIF